MTERSPALGICVAAMLLVAAAGCETKPQVRTNMDVSADLSAFKTYRLVSQPGPNRNGASTLLTSEFESSISRQLEARGYRRVDIAPDLLVNFNINNVTDRADIRLKPGYGISGGNYDYRFGYYGGFNGIETIHYQTGTANIDIVDAAGHKLLWQGIAAGKLSDSATKHPQTAINKVIERIFAQFPGHAAS
jgi:hypothetical protein